MRSKLIAAIIVVLVLIAAAVGAVVYMESRSAEPTEAPTVPSTSAQDTTGPAEPTEPAETTEPVETTQETIGYTFATENPDEMPPEDTFVEDNFIPAVTGGYEETAGTEDPDANETPEDKIG